MRRLNIYKFILIPAVLLSLQSCFVAKEYSRPEEVVENEAYRTDNLPTDTLSMARISWRELFTDPVLTNHIDRALENNIDIRIALQQIEAAGAYLKQAKAAYLPTLGVSAQVTHQELAQNSQFGSFFDGGITQYDATANLSWEADIWGRIRSNERAQRAAYLQTVAAHQAVKTRLVANIANLYYQLLALDEQLEVTQETVANRMNSLETIKALKEAGNVTEVGVKQTEAQLYRAQAVVIDLQNQIRLLENTFSILLGEAPHPVERTALGAQELNTRLQIGVPVQLLRNRPDVIAAEYNLMNAFQLKNVAKSNFYPALRLTANGGFQSLDLADLIDTNSLFASFVGSLTQPIFNRRQIRTQYEVAQAQQEIAYLEFRRAILDASREVSDALYNYAAADKKLDIKQDEFEAYELATSYSEELLNNGLVNYLEVLTARENTLNSQLELVNIRYDELSSIVDLYQALGGGWQ
ncbi:efflux transporter outer membrane subunit [Salinimicrobium tongyeongense]|uniref:Efflux transporter outer membrane subunit n=1 Tax=Salinimicrobium tongyeongense TaxID=2809707 RepID=A0ABY6NM57_9FLAO|nr:efflux transporter outer membrane subunit [Salinimicrobium tongyeongense]UZH53967.1 efflux transporter outer membrane subunit [Salinimicrobium tongyeongense]